MYPSQSQVINQSAIQNVRRQLEIAARAGKPIYFEFKMDGMVYIPHTNQLEDFDLYHEFINDDVQSIEFVLYSANPEDKNRRSFPFRIKEVEKASDALNGLDTKSLVQTELDKYITSQKIIGLTKELSEKESHIEQQDEWIIQISEELEALRQSAENSGDEKWMRRIALMGKFLSHVPAVQKNETLNGVFSTLGSLTDTSALEQQNGGAYQNQTNQTNQTNQSNQKNERVVSFEFTEEQEDQVENQSDTNPKGASTHSQKLNEGEMIFLNLFRILEKQLSLERIQNIILILESINQQPQQIDEIMEYLSIKIQH
jgi:hypothetical protein